MGLRGRWLSCVGVMFVAPPCCEAQGRLPLLDRSLPRALTETSSYSSPGEPHASGPRSGGRDSILDGTAIGFAAGAGFGIAYVSVVRDSEVDVGELHVQCADLRWSWGRCGVGYRCAATAIRARLGRDVWRSDPGCHGRPPQFASSCDGNRVAIPSFPARPGISHDVCRLGDV